MTSLPSKREISALMPTSEILTPVESTLAIALFAAFADGDRCEPERARIERLAAELGWEDLSAISRRILMGKLSLAGAVAGISDAEERRTAYELARAVCEVDGDLSADETAFLEELRGLFGLDGETSMQLDDEVDSLTLAPLAPSVGTALETPPPLPADAPDQSGMILRYAILNGALELLPETLATMAIVPLQMKMVYRIGKAHGAELDRASIKEFLATAGLGLGSQMLEGFARKWVGSLGKKMGGKKAGKIANQLTGSAFSFASTWAIGHLAVNYYEGGRRFGTAEMKAVYEPLLAKAKELHPRYLPEIQQQAQSLNPATVLEYVRGGREV
jgi:uncharacterized protein (DUF697 family)/tellurite resistance protein